MHYRCTQFWRKTEDEGLFYFDQNMPCSFSLGSIKIKDVPASKLKRDVWLVENSINTARLLMALDKDGDASNGIEITKAVSDEIKKKNITTVSDKPEDVLSEINGTISFLSGRVLPSADDAIIHLNATKLKAQEHNNKLNIPTGSGSESEVGLSQ